MNPGFSDPLALKGHGEMSSELANPAGAIQRT